MTGSLLVSSPPPITTRREAASVIGKCLYRDYVTLLPLVLQPDSLVLIDLLRTIASKKGYSSARVGQRAQLEPTTSSFPAERLGTV